MNQYSFTTMPVEPTPLPKTPKRRQSRGRTAAQKALAAGQIPRPLNAFLLYRRDLQPHILALRQTEDKTVNSKDASKWIADAWNREAEDVKEKYHSWARELKEEHLRKYPDFKFKPWKAKAAEAAAKEKAVLDEKTKLTPVKRPSTWDFKEVSAAEQRAKSMKRFKSPSTDSTPSSSRSSSPATDIEDTPMITSSANDAIAALSTDMELATRIESVLNEIPDHKTTTMIHPTSQQNFSFDIESLFNSVMGPNNFSNNLSWSLNQQTSLENLSFAYPNPSNLSFEFNLSWDAPPTQPQSQITSNAVNLPLTTSNPPTPTFDFNFSNDLSDLLSNTDPTPQFPNLLTDMETGTPLDSFSSTETSTSPTFKKPGQKRRATNLSLNTSLAPAKSLISALLTARISSPTASFTLSALASPQIGKKDSSASYFNIRISTPVGPGHGTTNFPGNGCRRASLPAMFLLSPMRPVHVNSPLAESPRFF